MPDYSKACIYKIKHLDDFDDENIYIGATCNLIRRRNEHKSVCFNQNVVNHNLLLYNYIKSALTLINVFLNESYYFKASYTNYILQFDNSKYEWLK